MEHLVRRLRAANLHQHEVRFGAPHFTYAVVAQDGVFRVRRLALTQEKADAHLAKTGRFMPEDAERLSEPTGPVVLEAPTLDGLIRLLQDLRLPS